MYKGFSDKLCRLNCDCKFARIFAGAPHHLWGTHYRGSSGVCLQCFGATFEDGGNVRMHHRVITGTRFALFAPILQLKHSKHCILWHQTSRSSQPFPRKVERRELIRHVPVSRVPWHSSLFFPVDEVDGTLMYFRWITSSLVISYSIWDDKC